MAFSIASAERKASGGGEPAPVTNLTGSLKIKFCGPPWSRSGDQGTENVLESLHKSLNLLPIEARWLAAGGSRRQLTGKIMALSRPRPLRGAHQGCSAMASSAARSIITMAPSEI